MGIKREIVRLGAIAHSPIIQRFKEQLDGTDTINFFSSSRKMFDEYLTSMDLLQRLIITSNAASEWFNLCVSLLSLVVVIPCVLSSVSFSYFSMFFL